MKKWFAMLCALVCLAMVPALAEETRTVTVNGSATVLTDADTASVNLGVVSVAKEASEASQVNAERIDRLIAALKEAGIEEKDITTSYYYVNARRNYSAPDENGEYPILGYEVSNSLAVTVRDINQVGAIIDLALANGANSCDGISFSASEGGEARDQALQAAIGEARRRGAIAAEACGGTLGDVLSLQENYSGGSVLINNKRAFGAVSAEAEMDAGTQILSDGLSYSATVTVTFELKERGNE